MVICCCTDSFSVRQNDERNSAVNVLGLWFSAASVACCFNLREFSKTWHMIVEKLLCFFEVEWRACVCVRVLGEKK